MCYEAERNLNRVTGRIDQLPWVDLPEVYKRDLVDKAEVIYRNIYHAEQLSLSKQLWAAVIKVLLSQPHIQD